MPGPVFTYSSDGFLIPIKTIGQLGNMCGALPVRNDSYSSTVPSLLSGK
jgi:hypothetical protein